MDLLPSCRRTSCLGLCLIDVAGVICTILIGVLNSDRWVESCCIIDGVQVRFFLLNDV